jgi:hypothetical protein
MTALEVVFDEPSIKHGSWFPRSPYLKNCNCYLGDPTENNSFEKSMLFARTEQLFQEKLLIKMSSTVCQETLSEGLRPN